MNFRFSVICPVYNMEDYIEEAFNSIVNQTIGFNDAIQFIFVNDGSLDQSEDVCLDIKSRYPDNVVYVNKENGGVSSARNVGIELAEGEFVVFLDPDDKWELDAFERINSFLEEYDEEIDLCICKLEYFGEFEGKTHPLDFRFDKGNRVADLSCETSCVSSTIGNVVVRRSAIESVRFNESISIGEDSLFANTIVLRRLKLGIVADAVFYYRRNYGSGTGSTQAPYKKSWYLDVPRAFYLGLYEQSKRLYDKVVPYIQEVILYDLRWRKYNPVMESRLSDQEKEEYLEIIKSVVSQIDDERILLANGFNQNRKLNLLYLKHGNDLLRGAHVENTSLIGKDGLRLYNFRARRFFFVRTLEIEDGNAIIQGIALSGILGHSMRLFLKDEQGTKYSLETERFEKVDRKGYVGEVIVKAYSFCAKVPIRHGRQISFFAEYDGTVVELSPGYDADTGLERVSSSYTIIGDYVVKNTSRKLSFYNNTWMTRKTAKRQYMKAVASGKNSDEFVKGHMTELACREQIVRMKLKDRVAFITCRTADDTLLPNIEAVYQKCNSEKVVFGRKTPLTEKDIVEGVDLIYRSKVVVTDDYSFFLKRFGKKEGQTVIQLWHAAGAFKKFGQDGTEGFLAADRLYHKDYDCVAVSSPVITEIYAHAFDIDEDLVKPLGVPRTDIFYNTDKIEQIRSKVFEKHPELEGKEIILYAPTFRRNAGQQREFFYPDLDFQKLSCSLKDNQFFLICPHPVMENEIIDRTYNNIAVMRDFSTNDYMMVADLLVTDYSSVIFEFSLLNKPIAFFCYDYDMYNRDFYLDYETELPGPLLRNEEELFEYLSSDLFGVDNRMQRFRDKYMSACDGQSAERIAELVDRVCRGDSNYI